jgi:hypothetical protein
MRSIADTLKLTADIIAGLRASIDVDIALIGGYAVISHGAGRTTVDVDFLLYSDLIRENSSEFVDLFKRVLPGHFDTRWVEGSRMIDDPFPYDVLFLTDNSGEYPKMDFIIPRYKWELEGLRKARPLENVPFPVLPVPYLIAMKLRAGGPRDHSDVLDLYPFLSSEEKKETHRLAVSIKRDKNLQLLLETSTSVKKEPDDEDQLI